MRFNSDELLHLSNDSCDHEGRLTHKPPPRTLYDTAYKERWFKLKGNLLFYYRLNEYGAVEKNEPVGVFVLENITIQEERESVISPHAFSIVWKDDPEKRHFFYALSANNLSDWLAKLYSASYEALRAQLLILKLQIKKKSGQDPLLSSGINFPGHCENLNCITARLSNNYNSGQKSHSIQSQSNSSFKKSFSNNNLSSTFYKLTDSTEGSHSAPTSPGSHKRDKPSPPTKDSSSSPLVSSKAMSPKVPPRRHKSRKIKEEKFDTRSTSMVITSSASSASTGSFKCHLYSLEEEMDRILKSGSKDKIDTTQQMQPQP